MANNDTNPNNNIAHVSIIEGLISQVIEHLESIEPISPNQIWRHNLAMKYLAKWRVNQLFELRKAFE